MTGRAAREGGGHAPAAVRVRLSGARRTVALVGEAAGLLGDLAGIAPEWVNPGPASSDPFLTVFPDGQGRFRIVGDRGEKGRLDRVNTICDIVAGVSRERAASDLGRLFLHAAAVEIGGRLILFPAVRRAGKSLLSTCLARIGHRLFGDDVVPVSVGEDGVIRGEALGVGPRLRLPLPEALSDTTRAWMASHEVMANRQYSYLRPTVAAPLGDRLPIGAIVFLEREDSGEPRLERCDEGAEMGRLLHQNFARAAHSGDVLTLLGSLAEAVPVCRLGYSGPEPAAALLSRHFASSEMAEPRCPQLAGGALRPADFSRPRNWPDDPDRVRRRAGATVRRVGDSLHASDPEGRALHRLDPLTGGLWELMADPVTGDDLIRTVADAFPDVEHGRIAGDVRRLIRRLGEAGLLEAV